MGLRFLYGTRKSVFLTFLLTAVCGFGLNHACAQNGASTISSQGEGADARQGGRGHNVAYGIQAPVPIISRYSEVGTDYDNRTLVAMMGGGVRGNYQLSIIESYFGIGADVSVSLVGGTFPGLGSDEGVAVHVLTRAIPYITFGPSDAREETPNYEVRVGVGVARAGSSKALGSPKGLDALVGIDRTWGLADQRGVRLGLQLRAGIAGDNSNFLYLAPGISLSVVRGL